MLTIKCIFLFQKIIYIERLDLGTKFCQLNTKNLTNSSRGTNNSHQVIDFAS